VKQYILATKWEEYGRAIKCFRQPVKDIKQWWYKSKNETLKGNVHII